MINPQPLQRAIDGATTPVYPSSFSEIARGFKDKFSPKTWTSELAKQISGSADKKSHEYKAALRNVQRYEKGTHKHDHLCSCPWCCPDEPDGEDEMELLCEVNGVKLWACDTACRVDWPEGIHDHQQVFVNDYPAAEASFVKHVQEVDAR